MRDAERLWALGSGIVGLVAFVAGSLAVAAPRVDETSSVAVAELVRRRSRVIGGAVLSITGTGLLLWPLGAVAVAAGDEVWRSVAAVSMAAWALGFGLYAVGLLLLVGVVWRAAEDGGPGDDTIRLLLDLSHLLIWSVSAPIAAVAVVSTTIVGRQAGVLGSLVVAAAVLKVVTVVVEVVGTGRRTGWNAGGWALGVSGYASVLWFATVLAALV